MYDSIRLLILYYFLTTINDPFRRVLARAKWEDYVLVEPWTTQARIVLCVISSSNLDCARLNCSRGLFQNATSELKVVDSGPKLILKLELVGTDNPK